MGAGKQKACFFEFCAQNILFRRYAEILLEDIQKLVFAKAAQSRQLRNRQIAAEIFVNMGGDLSHIEGVGAHKSAFSDLFDKLIDEIQKGEIVTQQLLVPYKISVNAEEKDFILDNANSLQELGVEVQDFGLNSLIITQVPSLLVDIDLSSFITEILSDLQSFSRDKVVLRHKIATKACKSAVKAGDTLTNEEIEKLLDMVKESNSPLLCPHGRPYVVKITKSQVEKWFKRVL